MKELFVLWMVAVMNMMAPAHREHFIPEAQESFVQADARYREIAQAIIDVTFDQKEKPIFGGPQARSKTAVLIAYFFFMESGFRRDIQNGEGRERRGLAHYNDRGRSWCLGQLNLGSKKVNLGNGKWTTDSAQTTIDGYTGRELLASPEKCVRATLHAMQQSIGACSKLPFREQLAAYATGSCDIEKGKEISSQRFQGFSRIWKLGWPKHPQVADKQIDDPAPAGGVPSEVSAPQ